MSYQPIENYGITWPHSSRGQGVALAAQYPGWLIRTSANPSCGGSRQLRRDDTTSDRDEECYQGVR